MNVDNTIVCDDGDVCTAGEACSAGVCGGGEPVCLPSRQLAKTQSPGPEALGTAELNLHLRPDSVGAPCLALPATVTHR